MKKKSNFLGNIPHTTEASNNGFKFDTYRKFNDDLF